jgi:uncharacterized protein (TIGR00251 family)
MTEGAHPTWCTTDAHGVTLRVRVVPGARQTQIAHADGDHLRIRVAAPPVDGAANTELCRFLARTFGVRARDISVVLGSRSRMKAVRIEGDLVHLIETATTI